MNLNKKGFTLVEVLAVIVILGIIMVIMIPNINHLIKENEKDNYNILKNGIISAAKAYLSDYRYEIKVDFGDNTTCIEGEKNISVIDTQELTNSRIPIRILVEKNYLKESKNGISNPLNKSQKLNKEESYIVIKYNCKTKDYVYRLEDDYLTWN